jgi:hypothetical protein
MGLANARRGAVRTAVKMSVMLSLQEIVSKRVNRAASDTGRSNSPTSDNENVSDDNSTKGKASRGKRAGWSPSNSFYSFHSPLLDEAEFNLKKKRV